MKTQVVQITRQTRWSDWLRPGRWREWWRKDASREFIQFAKRRWGAHPLTGKKLVLVHQNAWYASILGYAFQARALAQYHGARLGSFNFGSHGARNLGELYGAFGAPTLLERESLAPFRAHAEAEAKEIFATLRTKRDVLDITIEGLSVGDLIYDQYLVMNYQATLDLQDPRLEATIAETLAIYWACAEFLDRNEVCAMILDHAVYASGGVMNRLAIKRGIPVFQSTYKPLVLLPTDRHKFHAAPGNAAGRPAGDGSAKLSFPYHLFRSVFAGLPAAKQAEALEAGRANLAARLGGAFDPGVLPGGSAYKPVAAGTPRAMQASDIPRILVMLHDYCDAPHAFRDLLFPDHYEWTDWLLARASETPWDWYVKPHPNITYDGNRATLNQQVLAEMKAKYPKINFLPPEVSNLQLISEGLTAMFTGYGTAGHEFAHFGIPAVNASDNPHINYGFCYHPRSLAELQTLVEQAGTLQPIGTSEEIAEYAYMRFVHFQGGAMLGVNLLPPGFENSPENFSKVGTPEILRIAATEADRLERELVSYMERFFAEGHDKLPLVPEA